MCQPTNLAVLPQLLHCSIELCHFLPDARCLVGLLAEVRVGLEFSRNSWQPKNLCKCVSTARTQHATMMKLNLPALPTRKLGSHSDFSAHGIRCFAIILAVENASKHQSAVCIPTIGFAPTKERHAAERCLCMMSSAETAGQGTQTLLLVFAREMLLRRSQCHKPWSPSQACFWLVVGEQLGHRLLLLVALPPTSPIQRRQY